MADLRGFKDRPVKRVRELAHCSHVGEYNLFIGEGSASDHVERRIGTWISASHSPTLYLYDGVTKWLTRHTESGECGIVPVGNGKCLVGFSTANALAAFEAFMTTPVPATLEDAVKRLRQLPPAEFRKLANEHRQRLAKHFFVEPEENKIVVRTAGGVDWSPEVKEWAKDTEARYGGARQRTVSVTYDNRRRFSYVSVWVVPFKSEKHALAFKLRWG